MYRSRILGLGAYVPPRVVTNHDLAKIMETSHEWIVERTGIEERRWVDPGEGVEGGDREGWPSAQGHRPPHLRDALAGPQLPRHRRVHAAAPRHQGDPL